MNRRINSSFNIKKAKGKVKTTNEVFGKTRTFCKDIKKSGNKRLVFFICLLRHLEYADYCILHRVFSWVVSKESGEEYLVDTNLNSAAESDKIFSALVFSILYNSSPILV